jgi:hypothetical protein
LHRPKVKKSAFDIKLKTFPGIEKFPDYNIIPCVICGTLLHKGEKLKSKEFKGETESIIHVMGCYACYGEKASKKRICPLCRNEMTLNGYLIGRMTTKKNGKKHLTVAGCNRCFNR